MLSPSAVRAPWCEQLLEFFGQPVILNELRGEIAFSEDGGSSQETYAEADLAGQQDSPAFRQITAVNVDGRISADGKVRVARCDDKGSVIVFKKLPPGMLSELLTSRRLPTSGGTYMGNPSWPAPGQR